MKNMKMKVMAVVFALCIVFTGTAYAVEMPVARYSGYFNEYKIYGSYFMDSDATPTGLDVTIEHDYDERMDYIDFYSTYRGGHVSYCKAFLTHVGGNVFLATNGDLALWLTFGDDGGMYVSIGDDMDKSCGFLAGLYESV